MNARSRIKLCPAVLLVAFCILTTPPAHAAPASTISGICTTGFAPPSPKPPGTADPRCGDDKSCPIGPCKGSPCFVATGNYTTSASDLQLPTSGFPLEMYRRYDSARFADGLSGIGWTATPMARLYYATYLFAAPSTYNRRAVITFPSGLGYEFTENADGTSFTPPPGRKDVLLKNGDGTYSLTPERSRSRYEFAATGNLTSMSDEFGNSLTVSYDASSRPQRIADASGSSRFLDISYGADGRISAVQDNSGRSVQYFYDASGYLTGVSDAMGRTTTYQYVNARFGKRLSRILDPWNREITAMTYDSMERLNSYTAEGMLYTYSYVPASSKTFKRDAFGNEWAYGLGAPGGLVTHRDFPGGGRRTSTFDADGRITVLFDEVGARTDTGYLGDGRVASVRKLDPEGVTMQNFHYTYDVNFPDQVVAVTPKDFYGTVIDRNWQEWKYDYWPSGSPAPGSLHHVYRVRQDGTTLDTLSTSTYDTKGRVISVADAGGAVTEYTYDAAGNLWKVTSPSNNDAGIRPVTTYTYDALGRVTAVTDPLGHATNYTYDAADRITSVTLPKPAVGSPLSFVTTTNYDLYDAGTGLVSTRVTDPNGRMSTQAHDQFGRLVRSTDALNATTVYGYDSGMLRSITDAHGYVTSYEYDAVQRLTATVFPDGARETYTYFLDGQLKTKTDRKNQTITYAYDGLKRLKSKTYPNLTAITYTYSGQNLTQVSDTSTTAGETHTFSYDPAYRVTSNAQGPRGTISYTYTPGDALASYTVAGGPTASYGYYPDGSLNTIQWTPVTGQFKYAYTPNGQYGTITFPNGQTRVHSYDDQGRLTQLANTHPTAGTLATYDYGYDLNHTTGLNTMLGQRVSMTATVPSQGLAAALTKYVYDSNYQLTRADYPPAPPFNGEVHSWTYDAIGNRLTSTVNGVTTNYTYQKIGTNPNNWQRLTSDGTSSYTYDANGNTLTQGSLTFGWDSENRMMNIGAGATASYAYDYQGRRAAKTSGATVQFLYDGLNLLSEAGPTSTNYLFGPGIDEPLATDRGGAVSYLAADALGSISLVGDSTATTQNSYTYDAWGSARSTTEAFAQPFRYTAREAGDTANQWFYRARFYAPNSGRFLSEDPIRDSAPGEPVFPLDSYTYVNNSPVDFVDPYGLYEHKNQKVTPGTPELRDFLTCLEACLGKSFVITATTNGRHSDPGHAAGTSADARPNGQPSKKWFCCAEKCGAAYALNEVKKKTKHGDGPHYHFQTRPPKNKNRGDLPPSCEGTRC